MTGTLGLSIGADTPAQLTFNVADGTPVIDGNTGSPVTVGGIALKYFIDPVSGLLIATTGAAYNDGTIGFIVSLDPSGTGSYQFSIFEDLSNGTTTEFNDLTSSAAGNVNYRGVGEDDPATTIDLLLSGTANGAIATVNTDSDSIGVANQSMNASSGESLRIDFVNNLTTGAGTTTGFGYTGRAQTTSYQQEIPQVQGAQSNTVGFRVYAIDSTNTQATAPDSNPDNGLGAGETIEQITFVTVTDYLTGATSAEFNVLSLAIGATGNVGFGVTVTRNADGSVTFNGIQEGDSYAIKTTEEFSAIIVKATSGEFDLGVLSIGSFNAGEDIELSFGVVATDEDGDTATGTINVTVDQDGSSAGAMAAASTTSTQSLASFSTDTVLYGDTGTTTGGKGGGNGWKTNSFVNDNDGLSDQLSLRSFNTAFTATAAFGAMMVNFGEMGSTFDNLSTMSFDGFAFGGAESFQMGGYQSFEMQAFSAEAWLPQASFEAGASEYGYHGHNASLEFGGIGELATLEMSAFEVAAANDFLSQAPAFEQPMGLGGGFEMGGAMAEGLFALMPDAGGAIDLAAVSGLADVAAPKLAAIVEDLMASKSIDNLIDHFAGPANEFVGLANENGYLGHDALAAMIETGALSIGGGIAADMHEDAAALATMHA